MPVLSMFFGIIIRMYNESGERHNIPHIHCVYSDKHGGFLCVYDQLLSLFSRCLIISIS